MAVGASGQTPPVIDIEGGSDVDPPIDIPLSALANTGATVADPVLTVDGTHDDDGVTQPEGPRTIYKLAP